MFSQHPSLVKEQIKRLADVLEVNHIVYNYLILNNFV